MSEQIKRYDMKWNHDSMEDEMVEDAAGDYVTFHAHDMALAAKEARIAELEGLCAELYQVLGALDAPEHVLDKVSAAANGEPVPEIELLPFEVAAQQQDEPVNFDLERMQKAVGGPFYEIPEGLSREQLREWMLDPNKQPARQVGDVQLTGEYHADVNMLLERIPRQVGGGDRSAKAILEDVARYAPGVGLPAPLHQAALDANDWLKSGAALAPAAVVMPEYERNHAGLIVESVHSPWNAALDAVARLNRRAIPAGLLEKAAELLKGYQQVIEGCHSSEIERFDYLPEVQGIAAELRALLGKEGE